MTPISFPGLIVILTSIILALLLSICPLPGWLSIFQPQWLALVVIYWSLTLSHRMSIGIAWVLGLLLDGLYGTVLGEHALAMAVISYLIGRLHQQIRLFPLLQQGLVVFIVIILYQAILLWIQGMLGGLGEIHWFWVSTVVSTLLWPWVFMVLGYFKRRYRIE